MGYPGRTNPAIHAARGRSPLLQTAETFRHEALLYDGEVGFLTGTFLYPRGRRRRGAGAGGGQCGQDRPAAGGFGGAADRVALPTWPTSGPTGPDHPRLRDFVASIDGGGGRPGDRRAHWAARTPDELVEAERHEALLNLAFAGVPAWPLPVRHRGARSRRARGGRAEPSVRQRGRGRLAERRLPRAGAGGRAVRDAAARPAWAAGRARLRLGVAGRAADLVARHATAAGLDPTLAADLVLAVDEVATNSLRHGGGRGMLRIWRDGGALVCEVRDAGRIENPMVGRSARRRSATAAAGCGWSTSSATWFSCAASPTGPPSGCTCTCPEDDGDPTRVQVGSPGARATGRRAAELACGPGALGHVELDGRPRSANGSRSSEWR